MLRKTKTNFMSWAWVTKNLVRKWHTKITLGIKKERWAGIYNKVEMYRATDSEKLETKWGHVRKVDLTEVSFKYEQK